MSNTPPEQGPHGEWPQGQQPPQDPQGVPQQPPAGEPPQPPQQQYPAQGGYSPQDQQWAASQQPGGAAPQGQGGSSKGLCMVLILVGVVLIAVLGVLLWFFLGRDTYPDRGLSADEMERLVAEDGNVPAGFELGQVDAEDSGTTWGELHGNISESWWDEQIEEMRDLEGELEGAEQCAAGIEAHHDFLLDRAESMEEDDVAVESELHADYYSDAGSINMSAWSYHELPGDNPWLDRFDICIPVEGERDGTSAEVEIISSGNREGYVARYEDRLEMVIAEEFGPTSVEAYATSDDPEDEQRLREATDELIDYAEEQIQQID